MSSVILRACIVESFFLNPNWFSYTNCELLGMYIVAVALTSPQFYLCSTKVI